MSELSLAYRPLPQMVDAHADRNPKLHDLEAITASMERFGYFEPVILDERTGMLLAGHGRIEALDHLCRTGHPPPPGVRQEEDDPDAWLVPVITGWRSSDDSHADAARIAANRLVERGSWDVAMLDDIFAELAGTELATLTGFDPDQIEDLLADTATYEVPDAPTDAAYVGERKVPDDDGTTQAAPPRRAQGLREAYLVMTVEQHEEYTRLVDQLRHNPDQPVADIVIDALRKATT